MTEQLNWWEKILKFIVELFDSLIKTPNSIGTLLEQSETLSGSKIINAIGEKYLVDKASFITEKYASMINNLSPIQKEYIYHISILKSAETTELTFDEVLELGDVIVKCSELGLEISEEISGFWNEVISISKEISEQVVDIGVRVAAKTFVGFLPI